MNRRSLHKKKWKKQQELIFIYFHKKSKILRRHKLMNKKFDAADKREYFRKKNEPILISDELLEELILFYEDIEFFREVVKKILSKCTE